MPISRRTSTRWKQGRSFMKVCPRPSQLPSKLSKTLRRRLRTSRSKSLGSKLKKGKISLIELLNVLGGLMMLSRSRLVYPSMLIQLSTLRNSLRGWRR
jgi:hypothetical protein